MKKNLFIFLLMLSLLTNTKAWAQKTDRVLNVPDYNLNSFLSKSLDTLYTTDTCFAGIYCIAFVLEKSGDALEIEYPETMPFSYRNAITENIHSLSNKWDSGFLKFVSDGRKKIVQPIWIETNYECPLQENFYSKKLKEDSLDSETFKYDMAKYMLAIYLKLYSNVRNTFANSYEAIKENSYTDCILMSPCIVIQKEKKSRSRK